jgi:chromosome segregation ATPase
MALESQLQDRDATIAGQERRLASERERCAEQAAQLEQTRADLERERVAVSAAVDRAARLERECAEITARVSAADAAHATATRELAAARATEASIREAVLVLEGERSDAAARGDRAAERVRQLTSEIAEAESRRAAEAASAADALAAARAECDALARRLRDAETRAAAARTEDARRVEVAEQALRTAKDTLAAREARLSATLSGDAAAKGRIEVLEAQLAQERELATRLRLRAEHHAGVASSLEAKRLVACTERDAAADRLGAAERAAAQATARATRAAEDVARVRRREENAREAGARARADLERRIAELTECLEAPSVVPAPAGAGSAAGPGGHDDSARVAERVRAEERARTSRLLAQVRERCMELEDAAAANRDGFQEQIRELESRWRDAVAECERLRGGSAGVETSQDTA